MTDLINSAGNPGGSQLSTFSVRVDPQGALPCPFDQFGNLITNSSCAVTPPLNPAANARSYRFTDWAVYAQDSFRLTPRLTVNYGLRYEHYGVQHNNKQGLDSNFYYGSGSGIEQQVQSGQVRLTQKSSVGQFWAPRWGTPAPRVGFAYDLFGTGRSSLRGGFGISYERNFGNVTYNASFNPPASAVVSANCAPGDVGCTTLVTNSNLGPLGLPGPASFLPPVELRMPDPRINVASTQFWSLALQQQVAQNSIMELSYSGAHGVHLYDLNNINQVGWGQAYLGQPLISGAACPGSGYVSFNILRTQLRVPYPGKPAICSHQHARQQRRKQLQRFELQIPDAGYSPQRPQPGGELHLGALTGRHEFDLRRRPARLSSPAGFGNLGYTDFFNPKLDWGSSDYDIRNRFVVAPIWETPWRKNGKSVASQALGAGRWWASIPRAPGPHSAFSTTTTSRLATPIHG